MRETGAGSGERFLSAQTAGAARTAQYRSPLPAPSWVP